MRIDGRKSNGMRRRQDICELLLEQGFVDVQELCERLEVNAATIRRDLERLEQQGAVRRVHGGAYAQSNHQGVMLDFELRMGSHADAKRRVAAAAARLVEDGDTVYLDNGTTAVMIAEELATRPNVVVVTPSMAAAEVLRPAAGIELFVIGGRYLPLMRGNVGPFAEEMVRSFRFRKMFLGTAGIDLRSRQLTMSSMDEVPLKRAAIVQSERVILAVDSSKFEKPSLISMIPLAGVHQIVTDSLPSPVAEVLAEMAITPLLAD